MPELYYKAMRFFKEIMKDRAKDILGRIRLTCGSGTVRKVISKAAKGHNTLITWLLEFDEVLRVTTL